MKIVSFIFISLLSLQAFAANSISGARSLRLECSNAAESNREPIKESENAYLRHKFMANNSTSVNNDSYITYDAIVTISDEIENGVQVDLMMSDKNIATFNPKVLTLGECTDEYSEFCKKNSGVDVEIQAFSFRYMINTDCKIFIAR